MASIKFLLQFIYLITQTSLQLTQAETLSRIDVHHHFYPSFISEAIIENGAVPSAWFLPNWTLQADREFCTTFNVKKAILSLTAPGVSIEKDPSKAANLARRSNAYAAEIRDHDPDHYGFFANLPDLLDTQACLDEIAYAFDTLHANGVVLYSRYGKDNNYLGHANFTSLWQELNRRKAVVFIHPTDPVDVRLANENMALPVYDYPHETGRTAMDLILPGTLKKYAPDCKIILSHAGGDLPYLVYRAAGLLPYSPAMAEIQQSTEDILEQARSFYFDVAISSNPITLDALLSFAKPDHILFGTDFPNAPNDSIRYFSSNFDAYEMDQSIRNSIEHGAAEKIL